MVRLLLLVSPLRAGSHMVRSMLRDDPSIRDVGLEHHPVSAADLPTFRAAEGTALVPLKYGYRAFTRHCIEAVSLGEGCALILHRRDTQAQARSLARALAYSAWVEPAGEPVDVSVAEVEAMRTRNSQDLALILDAIRIPNVLLAYEDATTEAVGEALRDLLGREVVVTAPATVKIGEP